MLLFDYFVNKTVDIITKYVYYTEREGRAYGR